MSPIAQKIYELRMRRNLRQAELTAEMGYEQAYYSAIECGLKGPPTAEFVERFIDVVGASDEEADALRIALAASDRKLILAPDARQPLYWLLHDLRVRLPDLHDCEIAIMREVLWMRERLDTAPLQVPRRLKRRTKEKEAASA